MGPASWAEGHQGGRREWKLVWASWKVIWQCQSKLPRLLLFDQQSNVSKRIFPIVHVTLDMLFKAAEAQCYSLQHWIEWYGIGNNPCIHRWFNALWTTTKNNNHSSDSYHPLHARHYSKCIIWSGVRGTSAPLRDAQKTPGASSVYKVGPAARAASLTWSTLSTWTPNLPPKPRTESTCEQCLESFD